MSLLAATIRETKTKGEVKSLRSKGMVPGIIYGGEEPNQKISVSVKEVKNLLNTCGASLCLVALPGSRVSVWSSFYEYSHAPRPIGAARSR